VLSSPAAPPPSPPLFPAALKRAALACLRQGGLTPGASIQFEKSLFELNTDN